MIERSKRLDIIILTVLSVCLCVSVIFMIIFIPDRPSDQIRPFLNNGKKWKIAYCEGGHYRTYILTLVGFFEGLQNKGWINSFDRNRIPSNVFDKNDTDDLWYWMHKNTTSDYIDFSPENYWTLGWLDTLREENKVAIANAWKTKSFDVLLVFGTRMGKDLIKPENKFPMLLLSVTDPVEAKIIKSDESTGYKNVFTIYDPDRIDRGVKLFHELYHFKTLGIVALDNPPNDAASGGDVLKRMSKELNYKLERCSLYNLVSDEVSTVQGFKDCVIKMGDSKSIDAFMFTMIAGITPKTVPDLVALLNKYKIPSASIDSNFVEHGVLLSYGMVDDYNEQMGKLASDALVQIFRGTKPGSIKNPYKSIHRGVLLNLRTAKELGIQLPLGLVHSALKTYP